MSKAKSSPLKGRTLSPEVIARQQAAKVAKRAARANGASSDERIADTLVILRKAYAQWPEEKRGKRDGLPGQAKTLLVLAIRTLEGTS
jgi:hypothetical protein